MSHKFHSGKFRSSSIANFGLESSYASFVSAFMNNSTCRMTVGLHTHTSGPKSWIKSTYDQQQSHEVLETETMPCWICLGGHAIGITVKSSAKTHRGCKSSTEQGVIIDGFYCYTIYGNALCGTHTRRQSLSNTPKISDNNTYMFLIGVAGLEDKPTHVSEATHRR